LANRLHEEDACHHTCTLLSWSKSGNVSLEIHP
jgi:hypothetical protein